MATKEQYAEWLVRIIEGDDYLLDTIYGALSKDGFTDEQGFWVYEGEDE